MRDWAATVVFVLNVVILIIGVFGLGRSSQLYASQRVQFVAVTLSAALKIAFLAFDKPDAGSMVAVLSDMGLCMIVPFLLVWGSSLHYAVRRTQTRTAPAASAGTGTTPAHQPLPLPAVTAIGDPTANAAAVQRWGTMSLRGPTGTGVGLAAAVSIVPTAHQRSVSDPSHGHARAAANSICVVWTSTGWFAGALIGVCVILDIAVRVLLNDNGVSVRVQDGIFYFSLVLASGALTASICSAFHDLYIALSAHALLPPGTLPAITPKSPAAALLAASPLPVRHSPPAPAPVSANATSPLPPAHIPVAPETNVEPFRGGLDSNNPVSSTIEESPPHQTDDATAIAAVARAPPHALDTAAALSGSPASGTAIGAVAATTSTLTPNSESSPGTCSATPAVITEPPLPVQLPGAAAAASASGAAVLHPAPNQPPVTHPIPPVRRPSADKSSALQFTTTRRPSADKTLAFGHLRRPSADRSNLLLLHPASAGAAVAPGSTSPAPVGASLLRPPPGTGAAVVAVGGSPLAAATPASPQTSSTLSLHNAHRLQHHLSATHGGLLGDHKTEKPPVPPTPHSHTAAPARGIFEPRYRSIVVFVCVCVLGVVPWAVYALFVLGTALWIPSAGEDNTEARQLLTAVSHIVQSVQLVVCAGIVLRVMTHSQRLRMVHAAADREYDSHHSGRDSPHGLGLVSPALIAATTGLPRRRLSGSPAQSVHRIGMRGRSISINAIPVFPISQPSALPIGSPPPPPPPPQLAHGSLPASSTRTSPNQFSSTVQFAAAPTAPAPAAESVVHI